MIGAFLIGLFGSLHCVGMCGPVMIAFLGPRQSKIGFILYHSGRLMSYILLGLLLGFLGAAIGLIELQQVFAIVLGVGLITLYGIPSLRHRIERYYVESRFYAYLKSFLAKNLSLRKKWFLSGVANGFFPCGLTYVAAAGAVAIGDPWLGIAFMALFGLGTLPALILVSLSGTLFSMRWKKILPSSISLIAFVSGFVLILRGILLSSPPFQRMVQENAAGLITVCGL